jgi:hypothetical protein
MSRSSDQKTAGLWSAAIALVAVAALACTSGTRASDESPAAVDVRARVAAPVDQSGSPAGSATSSEERPAPAPGKSPKGPPRSLFRCWQDGRMIFEGRGYGPLPSSQVVAELKSGDNSSGRVQVLDMYQGLCLLELPK